MTRDLDEAHRATLPEMRAAVAELNERARSGGGFSRRNFLVGASVVGGGVALAACSSSKKGSSTDTGAPTSSGGASGGAATDLKVAALAASLENLAVQTYGSGIQAATAGRLGA